MESNESEINVLISARFCLEDHAVTENAGDDTKELKKKMEHYGQRGHNDPIFFYILY